MKRALIGLVFLLCAYPVLGQKVNVKFDKNVDFSKYKTYVWVKGMPARNPLIDKMITDAVDQQLAARGLTQSTDASADLQVMYMAAVGLDMQITGIQWYDGDDPNATPRSVIPPMNVSQGTLVVDLKDIKTERFVWRAMAKETLSQGPTSDMEADAKRMQKPVKKAVEKIFGKYPGGKK